MRKVNKIRILVVIVVAAFIMQAGYVAYSMLGSNLNNKQIAEAGSTAASNSSSQDTSTANSNIGTDSPSQAVIVDNQLKDDTSIEISQDILALIKSSDPDNYTKNVDNYKQLLKDLNVHVIFKNEIERLLKSGKKLPDILTAYAFLNDCYGSMTNLEEMVTKKETGKKWVDIFKEYNKINPEFEPRNFDTQYLEKLLATPGIDHEDVMIADRISQNIKVEIDAVINKRIEGLNWRLIKAQYGIVNGLEKSPHLSVTREQLTKYASQTKLTEKNVIEALTLASKLGKPANDVLKAMKQGLSEEEIYAGAYEEKYY